MIELTPQTAAAGYAATVLPVAAALLWLRQDREAPGGLGCWAGALLGSAAQSLLVWLAVGRWVQPTAAALAVVVALLLTCGAVRSMGRRLKWPWVAAGLLLAGAWPMAVVQMRLGAAVMWAPVSVFGTLAAGFCGLLLVVRQPMDRSVGYRVAGAALALWGLQRGVGPMLAEALPTMAAGGLMLVQALTVVFVAALAVGVVRIQETELAEFQAMVKASLQQLQSIVEASPVPIILARPSDGRIVFANSSAVDLLGLESSMSHQLRLWDYFDDALQLEEVAHRARAGKGVNQQEVRLCTGHETVLWALLAMRHVDYGDGRAVLVTLTDISAGKQTEQRLHRLATTDPLTGALSRRAYLELSLSEAERAQRHHRPLSVMFIDIDYFKEINDAGGHALGDQVLRTLCERAQAMLRRHDLLGRLGGDELAITMPETSLDGARILADRLTASLREIKVRAGDRSTTFTVSIGLAQRLADEDFLTLLDRADARLYEAKQAGRNQVAGSA